MRLVYEMTYDDFLQFAQLANKISPHAKHVRSQMLWLLMLVGVVILLPWLGDLLAGNYHNFIYMLLITLALLGVIYFGGRVLEPWMAKRMHPAAMVKAALGPRILSVTSAGLREQRPEGETLTYWPALDRVVDTEQMALIFIGPIQAHIIPKQRVTEGDVAAFLSEVEQRRAQAATANNSAGVEQ